MGETRINDLERKSKLQLGNLMIVEDEFDTKKCTIQDFLHFVTDDDSSDDKMYSADAVDSIIRNLQISLSSELGTDIEELRTTLNNILRTTSKTPLPIGTVMFDLQSNKAEEYADWFGGVWSCIGNIDTYIGGTYNSSTGLYSGGKLVNLYMYKKTEGVDYPDSHCTHELLDARGPYNSLSERLAAERLISDKKYLKCPLITLDTAEAPVIKGPGIGVNLLFKNLSTQNFIVQCESANLFDMDGCDSDDSGITIEDTGISFFMSASGKITFRVKINNTPLNAGTYYMFCNEDFQNGAESFTFDILYTDGTTDTVSPLMNKTIIEFDAKKQFNYIRFNMIGQFAATPVNDPSSYMLKLTGLMISKYKNLMGYLKYFKRVETHTAQEAVEDVNYGYITEGDVIFSSDREFTISYYDTSYTISPNENLPESIATTKCTGTNDYCGLIENEGTYIYLNDLTNANENVAKLAKDKTVIRNGFECSKVTLLDYVDGQKPTFVKTLPGVMSMALTKYITLQMYIDCTLYSKLFASDAISICISSDDAAATPVNYYIYNIGNTQFVQGWNNIKIKLSDFTRVGNPDLGAIRQIRLIVTTSNVSAGYSLWFSAIILDQTIKPTILLAFDGTYDTAFDYQFPLVYSNDIPATVFLNDRVTWTRDYMNMICSLAYTYGWDIGDYGCNPDKEILIEDDNPREQYLALKAAKDYLTDNYIGSPISYSAAFGNLRPITVPILKGLGFKIAKARSSSLCSFFSKNEFTLPMCLISNLFTSDEIINKIDTAVETGQCIVVYTNNVTEYGDESTASKTSFENVLNHIIKLKQEGKVQCLTFRDFYTKCVDE